MRQTRRRKINARLSSLLFLTTASIAGALGFSGCNSGDTGAGDTCVSDNQYFAEKIWAPIVAQKCVSCHNRGGQAKDSGLVLQSSAEAGYLDSNFEVFKAASTLQQDGQSQVLVMPTGGSAARKHPGGTVIQKGTEEYAAMEELVRRFDEPTACEADVSGTFAGALLMTPSETLRKATLGLGARLPTAAEESAVESGGEAALQPILDKLLTEPAFYERLKEIYNDLFLTDRYLGGADALQLLDGKSDYYFPFWFDGVGGPDLIMKYGAQNADDLRNMLRFYTNYGVAREPLELIAHVVRENKPFTEILTANYIMVNPFSAQSFGMTDVTFKNDADYTEFQEGHIQDFPHAGVLTSPMFLSRFPTTETNRNRARSRYVFKFFLGTDILKTAQQPLDPTKIDAFNPTLNKADCTICHSVVDPIAGAFQNFQDDDQIRFDPAFSWFTDMKPPGFGTEEMPKPQFSAALQWLGPRVANDPRFALSAVYTIFTGLTGQEPLVAPSETNDKDFSLKFKAYLAQYYAFNAIAKDFAEHGYDLKRVVKGIVNSRFYKAKNAVPLSAEQKVELSEVGMGRLLSPEQLNRKIQAVLGYPWRDYKYGNDFLLRGDQYRLLYGGIDSADVTTRVTAPNGIMSNIIDRMSNEMSCMAVPRDFYKEKEDRKLFPFVDVSHSPKDKNGYEIPAAVEAIKKNIQHLHKLILGERLDINDPEITRTYQLFLDTWQAGQDGMSSSDPMVKDRYSDSLPGECRVYSDYWTDAPVPEGTAIDQDQSYTIRAWMAVTSYLLSDYAFVYE